MPAKAAFGHNQACRRRSLFGARLFGVIFLPAVGRGLVGAGVVDEVNDFPVLLPEHPSELEALFGGPRLLGSIGGASQGAQYVGVSLKLTSEVRCERDGAGWCECGPGGGRRS